MEIIDFVKLHGNHQPLAYCILKISLLTTALVGLFNDDQRQQQIQQIRHQRVGEQQPIYLPTTPSNWFIEQSHNQLQQTPQEQQNNFSY